MELRRLSRKARRRSQLASLLAPCDGASGRRRDTVVDVLLVDGDLDGLLTVGEDLVHIVLDGEHHRHLGVVPRGPTRGVAVGDRRLHDVVVDVADTVEADRGISDLGRRTRRVLVDERVGVLVLAVVEDVAVVRLVGDHLGRRAVGIVDPGGHARGVVIPSAGNHQIVRRATDFLRGGSRDEDRRISGCKRSAGRAETEKGNQHRNQQCRESSLELQTSAHSEHPFLSRAGHR